MTSISNNLFNISDFHQFHSSEDESEIDTEDTLSLGNEVQSDHDTEPFDNGISESEDESGSEEQWDSDSEDESGSEE